MILGWLILSSIWIQAQNCEGVYTQSPSTPGMGTLPKAILFDPDRGLTYVANGTDYGGDTNIQQLAAWDGENWSKLGDFTCTSCGNGVVESLELDDQGNLYIGGFFEGIEDLNGNFTASKNIVKYNPHLGTFEALGQGVEGSMVYDIVFHNDTLFVGGIFDQARNIGQLIPVKNIALYDLNAQTWSAMGQGIGTFNLSTDDKGYVFALEMHQNGHLLVGGHFSKINGADTVYSTAQWSSNGGWEPLGSGIREFSLTNSFPGRVSDIAIEPGTGDVYFCGVFGAFYPSIGVGTGLARLNYAGQSTNYLTGLGRKSSGLWATYDLFIHPSTNILYVGGNFNSDDADPFTPSPGEYIASYDLNTYTWNSLGGGVTQAQPGQEVSAIGQSDNGILIGGNFTKFDSSFCRYLVGWEWDQSVQSEAVNVLGEGTRGYQTEIYTITPFLMGGQFEYVGDEQVKGISSLPDNGFPELGRLGVQGFYPSQIRDIATKKTWNGDSLLIVGVFDTLGINNKLGLNPIRAASIALITAQTPFGGSTQFSWTPLATSLSGPGNFSTVTTGAWWNGQILAAGNFTAIDGVAINGLGARSSSGIWTQFANIQGGTIEVILNDGDSLLYVGGTFSSINGLAVDGVAVFDGTNWSALGGGLGFYNDVYALAKDPLTEEIAIGGNIQTAFQTNGSTLQSAGLMFWDGSQWKTRGEVEAVFAPATPYFQIVRALAYDDNGELYVGGEFSGIAGVPADRIIKYEPSVGWKALQQGISGTDPGGSSRVNSLFLRDGELFVGGNFSRVGDFQASDWTVYRTNLDEFELIGDDYELNCLQEYTEVHSANNIPLVWSTGDRSSTARADVNYFDLNKNENKKVWIYAELNLQGCLLQDSIEVPILAPSRALEDRGHYTIGDSSYFWIKPGLSKEVVGYQANMISWNAPGRYALDFFDERDTVAFQAPCRGDYEALFYTFLVDRSIDPNNQCQDFDTLAFQAPYDKKYSIIDDVTPWRCGTTMALSYGDYRNYQWNTGSDSFLTYAEEPFISGRDSFWLTVEADTALPLFRTDTLFCRVKDSVKIIEGKNINTGFNQKYISTQGDSLKVTFTKDYLSYVEWFNWDLGDGDTLAFYPEDSSWTHLIHQYGQAGMYTLRVIAFNYQCGADTIFFNVDVNTVDNEELIQEAELSLYPNPAKSHFFLENGSGESTKGLIQLFDSGGRLLFRKQTGFLAGERKQFPLDHLPDGMYRLLWMDQKGRRFSQSIIKRY